MTTFVDSYRFAVAGGGGDLPVDGAVLWLDASDTATITDAGSGAVSEWRDKSASGWDVAQATSGARPTTGTVTINSLNVIDFDGGDYLDMTGSSIANAAVTVFVVGREDSAVDFAGFVTANTGSGSDNSGGWTMNSADGSRTMFVDRVGTGIGVGAAGATPLGVYAARMGSGSPNLRLYDGAGASVSATSATTGTTTGIVVGGRYQSGSVSGSYRLNGAIAEIIGYASELSTTDTNTIGDYLADKWGLTWTAI